MGNDFAIEVVRRFIVTGGGEDVLAEGKRILGLDRDESGRGLGHGCAIHAQGHPIRGDGGFEADLSRSHGRRLEPGHLAIDAEIEGGDTFDKMEGITLFLSSVGEDDALPLAWTYFDKM